MWKNDEKLNSMIHNLQETFAVYGVPYALEVLLLYALRRIMKRSFFAGYSLLEKKLKKYLELVIA